MDDVIVTPDGRMVGRLDRLRRPHRHHPGAFVQNDVEHLTLNVVRDTFTDNDLPSC
jgi:hypothetical protein